MFLAICNQYTNETKTRTHQTTAKRRNQNKLGKNKMLKKKFPIRELQPSFEIGSIQLLHGWLAVKESYRGNVQHHIINEIEIEKNK